MIDTGIVQIPKRRSDFIYGAHWTDPETGNVSTRLAKSREVLIRWIDANLWEEDDPELDYPDLHWERKKIKMFVYSPVEYPDGCNFAYDT